VDFYDAAVTGKPSPPEPMWIARAAWWLRVQITWPFEVHRLKRAGFRRVGWQTWEYRGGA
jgi:hypothetical protein